VSQVRETHYIVRRPADKPGTDEGCGTDGGSSWPCCHPRLRGIACPDGRLAFARNDLARTDARFPTIPRKPATFTEDLKTASIVRARVDPLLTGTSQNASRTNCSRTRTFFSDRKPS
jgi:hypothetical protein